MTTQADNVSLWGGRFSGGPSPELQALSQTKTNFMIVTSHEMRTPLTVLRGYHELLEEGALGAEAVGSPSAGGRMLVPMQSGQGTFGP